MSPLPDGFTAHHHDSILVTGATGFIGSRLVRALFARGFRHVRAFTRPGSQLAGLDPRAEVVRGNLLSRTDCEAAVKDIDVIFHLAAGRGEKSFPDAFMNSAVTTRNLLEAAAARTSLARFVNVSSFVVYANQQKPLGRVLDESCPIETRPEHRGDPYCFAKVKQDGIVQDYGGRLNIPYVIVRPGYVYGPGKQAITGRVGIDTFGLFLHLGGSNPVPFTFVDNCVEAIVRAGFTAGVDGEVFNVVDDDLPSSRMFLRMYKNNVRRFRSVYLPHAASYAFCWLWEKYAAWSEEQLPPMFNRRGWHAYWKKTRYSNDKLKRRLGWAPVISTPDGFRRYFESCRAEHSHA